jgi:hypothetical protein
LRVLLRHRQSTRLRARTGSCRDLVLGLLVTVRDEAVQEAAGSALRVSIIVFGFGDVAVQVTMRFVVDVVVVIEFVVVGFTL